MPVPQTCTRASKTILQTIASLCVVLWVPVAICYSSLGNIENYKREAEKAIGRSINVLTMAESSVEMGLTSFDRPENVIIRIRAGLPHPLRNEVMAHEFGHVILRGRGFLGGEGGLTSTGKERDRVFMMAAAETLSNCYEDVLADAEAKRRGFHPERLNDYTAQKTKDATTMFDIQKMKNKDALWPNYEALYLYCSALRPHTYDEHAFEQQFAIEPRIEQLRKQLVRVLGLGPCKNPNTCFERSKRLRNVAGFSGLVLLRNPSTRQLE